VAGYQPVCSDDLFFGLCRTWENSKPWNLKKLAVNMAAGNNTNSLTI
jgi:hypothetical protein